jgi:hypothetical protein
VFNDVSAGGLRGPQAVSEELALQKLFETLNERNMHPYMCAETFCWLTFNRK